MAPQRRPPLQPPIPPHKANAGSYASSTKRNNGDSNYAARDQATYNDTAFMPAVSRRGGRPPGGPSVGFATSANTHPAMLANSTNVGRSLTRGKTLTRPDRHITPAPLLNPHLAPGVSASVATVPSQRGFSRFWKPWSFYIFVSTFWAPSFMLSACGMKERPKQRAWREKVALCSVALIMGGAVGYITIGLQRTLCPTDSTNTPDNFISLGHEQGYVGIQGWMFSAENASNTVNGINFQTLARQLSGQDVTNLFDTSSVEPTQCAGQRGSYATVSLCTNATTGPAVNTTSGGCVLGKLTPQYLTSLGLKNSTKRVGWSWEQVTRFPNYMVLDGMVVNMGPYLSAFPRANGADLIDTTIRTALLNATADGGKDATRLFFNRANLADTGRCIEYRYRAGHIDKITPGCFASQLFLYVSLVVILAVVLARFAMACVFHWFLSYKLVQPPKNLRRKVISPAVMPAGANTSVNNANGAAPWAVVANAKLKAANQARKSLLTGGKGRNGHDEKAALAVATVGKRTPKLVDQNGMLSMAAIGAELFCACLVTCYSEGEDSIRTTLDSIAATDYADSRKMMFVVCDGMITGSGEKISTPDVCVGLLDADSRFDNPQPMSYLAVSAGRKQHNQAMIYAGHYTQVKGHRTPCIVIVKTGTTEEARDPKPGNRGKRDSQMILMNFFSRVTYNDRMTPLDYDLFRKCHALMGVTPDFFEVVLMIDADTKIFPDSVKQLVNCMQHDNMIMGVCGETRIANKRQSWVTAIQVYEYYISHHLSKAFESVFGGVTCLPGCFSMYRLKARKAGDSDWVPVLTQSGICSEYSQSDVQTLHEKNLLLLGEDRFLTTLMLRTFPHRKMMFCPQARCRTVAPDTFKVLLSQRRRWINSTIHNLMELVRVQDLCGTFCFSMQFMVFMDLVGTVVLPVAICLTYSLVINSIITPPKQFSDAIPLLLLAAVLGLPALLILMATGKVIYVSWMLIYLVSLPIWNFVLPVYSFWHFDDFSWGQTRIVAGEKKGTAHGSERDGTTIEVNAVPLRRWEDWERSRMRKIKREHKRRAEFQRAFGTRTFYGDSNTLSTYEPSDTASMFSSEDDRWGLQIGQYAEEPAGSLPPVGLYNVDDGMSEGGDTVHADQLEAMLEQGWGEDDDTLDGPDSAKWSGQGHQQYYRGQPYSSSSEDPSPISPFGSQYPPQVQQYPTQQYQPTPGRMYQLADDKSSSDSNSSLAILNQDPNQSATSMTSPISPHRAEFDGVRRYDAGYHPPAQVPHTTAADSPTNASGFDSRPAGRGHVKRRSGGGSAG